MIENIVNIMRVLGKRKPGRMSSSAMQSQRKTADKIENESQTFVCALTPIINIYIYIYEISIGRSTITVHHVVVVSTSDLLFRT